MRGQGQGDITPRGNSGPIGAERAFGTTADEAPLAREGLFTEVLPRGLEFWEALNQEKLPRPRLGQLEGRLSSPG